MLTGGSATLPSSLPPTRAEGGQSSSRFQWGSTANIVVVSLILIIGIAAAILRQRTPDFMAEDAFYADAARNLLQHGFYGVNGNPETTQPPGLPAILALLFRIFGYSYSICVVAMAVFETLGFLLAYELLRRRVRNVVAGSICLILMSSPVVFAWSTRFVYACLPYFFTTMAALLCAEECEKANTGRSQFVWSAAFALAVVASLLIATGTIALLGAILMVVLATALRDRQLARRQLLKFLPALLLGLLAQTIWMYRKPAALEWPLPGYPESYWQQLKVKDGNHPELGFATWKDISPRIAKNTLAASDNFTQIVLRHGVNEKKTAIVIMPILLVLLGWASALWVTCGKDFAAWYFAGYVAIYLLWPFKMDLRFVLPVAPLACLYAWESIRGIAVASTAKPRLVGVVGSLISLFAAGSTTRQLYENWRIGDHSPSSALIILIWLIVGGVAVWMAYSGRSIFEGNLISRAVVFSPHVVPARRFQWVQYTAGAIAVALILLGLAIDTRVARENLNTENLLDAEETGPSEILPLDVSAGIWLRTHTNTDAIVMARSWPTVHHYAQRRVVWFPPISNPTVLFEGMLRQGVDYVVVVNRERSYWLPSEDDCFGRLLADHRQYFQLVLQTSRLSIFQFHDTQTSSAPELQPSVHIRPQSATVAGTRK